MISPTMPESPCTDTKIIPDFCFCQFIYKNGDFPATFVKERNCAAPPPIFKVDRHISPG